MARVINQDMKIGITTTRANVSALPMSLQIGGKRRIFGHFDGPTDSEFGKAFAQALQSAQAVPALAAHLASDESLTPIGQQKELRERGKDLLQQRAQTLRDVRHTKKRVAKERDKLLAINDYSIESNLHNRMIMRWSSMTPKERTRFLAPDSLRANKEMARALLTEPSVSTGIQDEQYDTLRDALLDEEQHEQLLALELEAKQADAAARAFDVALDVLAEHCGCTAADLDTVQLEDEDDAPKIQPVKIAGISKLLEDTQDDDD